MTSDVNSRNTDFADRALERIERMMLVIALAGLASAAALPGWRTCLSFAVGTAIAFLNFRWLKKGVFEVSELTVQSGVPASSKRIVGRFLLRYFLMALVAFVILIASRDSLYGFFAGLSLPVAAMLCEAVYATYRVIRNGNR